MLAELPGVFAADGPLAAALPGYRPRPQQIEVAEAVARSLVRAGEGEHRILLSEAGTGVGKTLAYLVPALLSGKRVVVATATRTLQEQVFVKDLPRVLTALEELTGPVKVAMLKGRSNYLCLAHLEQLRAGGPRPLIDAGLLASLVSWAGTSETGDRADFPGLDEGDAAWRHLTATASQCSGSACHRFYDCFLMQARQRSARARIVVVNHALYFADLALRAAGATELLPEHDAVIFDEAHAVEQSAIDAFAVRYSTAGVDAMLDQAAVAPMEDEGEATQRDQAVAAARQGSDRLAWAFAGESGARDRVIGEGELDKDSAPAAQVVDAALERLVGLLHRQQTADEGLAPTVRGLADARSALAFFMGLNEPGFVYFVETTQAAASRRRKGERAPGVVLTATPAGVGAELRRHLFAQVPSAVFTSATLAGGGDFALARRSLGLWSLSDDLELETQTVSSPFDYRQQALLYAPRHLPLPAQPGFVEAVAAECESLVRMSRGAAMLLFTSYRNMHAVAALVTPKLIHPVLIQGQAPRSSLLEAMRREPSVLFATHSFWEGVDLEGDALRLVVIDKLPFQSPRDPLVEARNELIEMHGGNPFEEDSLPRAVAELRQGFGRLIRSASDRGVVAILDSRLRMRRYASAFLDALPPCPRTERSEEVAIFYALGPST